MIKIIHEAYELYLKLLNFLFSPALFAIRLIWGVLFTMEGWSKFMDIPSTAQFYTSLGFSNPEFMVYLSASAELFGGLFLLAGLFSRVVAIPLIITMVVASIMAPSSHTFLGAGSGSTESFLSQIPLVFAYMTAVIMFFGPGKWSVDYLLKNKCFLCK